MVFRGNTMVLKRTYWKYSKIYRFDLINKNAHNVNNIMAVQVLHHKQDGIENWLVTVQENVLFSI